MSRDTRVVIAALLIGSLSGWLAGCDRAAERGPTAAHAPAPIADQEGAVCGMVVRDQSAPRAQVVHRDGTRAFLCSIGDLLAYLQVPSPHGAAEAVLVEVMAADEDPLEAHTGPHPWLPAAQAVFLVGIERRGIMGEPVLVYRDLETAARVARGTSAQALDFAALRSWWMERERADARAPVGDRSGAVAPSAEETR